MEIQKLLYDEYALRCIRLNKRRVFWLELNNTKLKPSKKADLRVVQKPNRKTTKYNDIDLNHWKDYDHVMTNTLWLFPSRLKEHGHSNDYHGNYIPQIAQQMYERYTKKNDVVLDMFFGSGTSGIEAINMDRRCIGVETGSC